MDVFLDNRSSPLADWTSLGNRKPVSKNKSVVALFTSMPVDPEALDVRETLRGQLSVGRSAFQTTSSSAYLARELLTFKDDLLQKRQSGMSLPYPLGFASSEGNDDSEKSILHYLDTSLTGLNNEGSP